MNKAPAFQFYPGDWLSSQRVSLMTLEEEGAYIRLLSYCWNHGSIPADPEKIARLIGKGASTTLATTLTTMFQPDGDKLIHSRLEAEREKQTEWREKSAAGGRKSAETRRLARESKRSETTAQPPLEGSLPNGSNQTSTLLSSPSPSDNPLLFPLEGDNQGNRLPRGWKKLTRAERQRHKVVSNSPEMEAVGNILGRKPSTLWTVAEAIALSEVNPSSEEVDLLTRYYALPPDDPERDIRRKGIETLLNHWNGELDKARGHFANNSAA